MEQIYNLVGNNNNPNKKTLLKIKNILIEHKKEIDQTPNPLKINISDKVRNSKIFEIVQEILGFLPICRTLFENGYHKTGYFSEEYKKWVITTYPKEMMKAALNRWYPIRYAAKHFSVDFCLKLNSYSTFSCLEDIFNEFIDGKKLFDAAVLIDRCAKKKEKLDETTSFSFLPFKGFDSGIFNSNDLNFVKFSIPYLGFSLNLEPSEEFKTSLQKWSELQSQIAKNSNLEMHEKKKNYCLNDYYNDYYSDDDCEEYYDYIFQTKEENSKCIYDKELKTILYNLKFLIKYSSYEIFCFFLDLNSSIKGDLQTDRAINTCNISRLEYLKTKGKLDFSFSLSYMFTVPDFSLEKIKELVEWLIINKLDLFERKSENKSKFAENVFNREIANYFHNFGFNIKPSKSWQHTKDYTDWCFDNNLEPDWFQFLYQNKDLNFILDVFEKASSLGFDIQKNFISLENNTILAKNVSKKNLQRLFNLKYDFLKFEWFTLQIYCPPLHFLKFLIDQCLPKDEKQKKEAIKKLQSKRLYEINDINYHDFLYNNGFYNHEDQSQTEEKFDMWSHAILSNDLNLIKWVGQKGYQSPSIDSWYNCKPDTEKLWKSFSKN